MRPDAAVVMCTHNRAAVIGRTLDRALAEVGATGIDLVVVDNASTDETPRVLAERQARGAPFRIVREPVLGSSQARNRGAAETRGEILVFLDDDTAPRPGWLAALLAPFAAPEVAGAGGRILLEFPTAPPAWLTPALHPALAAFDLGDEPRRIPTRPHDFYPFGGNLALRRRAFEAAGGFSTRLGLYGRDGLQKEETDLCYRVEQAGGELRYVPDAVVDHWVFSDRLRPEWFFARAVLSGKSNAIFELKNRGLHRALGLMRWHYLPFLTVRGYRPREPIDPERLVAECMRREALGYLRGLALGLGRLRALRRMDAVA
jgi:GT2 family glycosyltransferase